jgi:hypothetical protein
MILLGIGWNLAFSAGTIMLTGCYSPIEATDVQVVLIITFNYYF